VAQRSQRALVRALLERHGQTFAEELGIKLERPAPSNLFRLLVASILFSTRIRHEIAVEAAKALFREGWTTPQKLGSATWAQRVRVLNHSGYARYDESTSRMLGEDCELLLERYRGDLRRLRQEAGREPRRERALLKEFKGMGDVGVDIFFREVQLAWGELYPFADRRSRQAASRLSLPAEPASLARLVERRDFARLVAALVRTSLERDFDAMRAAA
jgi:hypothetical protein